ncbi:YdcF family protein [Thalassorhabdomicrobium marinisediminis]|uniref:YdcF family protein n=1 Tax=Thalassorhabdomicrobium marinisediminis TaxID=2170577 RepID=UPI0024915C47|nr:YdcF family protein [Thalassorhabdomicrobium marinisediminis]
MGVIRWLARLLKLGLYAYLLLSLAMLGWTFLWPRPEMNDLKQADAIVCLGGGISPNGTLTAPVLRRIERCVQLYEAGIAPVVVFTGGTTTADGMSAATEMGRFAVSMGVPPSAVIEEGRARSTLQNALFTLDLIPQARRLVVVSEAFHLPRAWASFRWAAWRVNDPDVSVTPVMSEPVRRDPVTGTVRWPMLLRESFALWFNGTRALAYSLSPEAPLTWLE